MTKEEIMEKLENNHRALADYIGSLSDKDFMFAPEGKWSAGRQLDHITRAITPLATGLRLPVFVIRLFFGKANRPSKSYEDLVKKYLSKLESGGKAGGRFIPPPIELTQRQKRIDKLVSLVRRLIKNINRISEARLDACILPHPLLGKVTMREMMYFTIYHAEHHLKYVKRNLGQ